MQPGVLGLVHHAHAATAQLLEDAVVRNDLIDHWIEMLGVQVEQVNEERGFCKQSSRRCMNSLGSRMSLRRYLRNIAWPRLSLRWGSRNETTLGLRPGLTNDRAEPALPFWAV